METQDAYEWGKRRWPISEFQLCSHHYHHYHHHHSSRVRPW